MAWDPIVNIFLDNFDNGTMDLNVHTGSGDTTITETGGTVNFYVPFGGRAGDENPDANDNATVLYPNPWSSSLNGCFILEAQVIDLTQVTTPVDARVYAGLYLSQASDGTDYNPLLRFSIGLESIQSQIDGAIQRYIVVNAIEQNNGSEDLAYSDSSISITALMDPKFRIYWNNSLEDYVVSGGESWLVDPGAWTPASYTLGTIRSQDLTATYSLDGGTTWYLLFQRKVDEDVFYDGSWPFYLQIAGIHGGNDRFGFQDVEATSSFEYLRVDFAESNLTGSTTTESYIEHQFNIDEIIGPALQNLPHQININQINIVGSINPVNYRNQFDELGNIIGLERILGEKNYNYKRRILDVFTNISNSSYRGLINGITRELGLSLFDCISINPKKNNSGAFLAADPYISINEAWIFLYSDYSNSKLDWSINRLTTGNNYEHINSLVNFINTTTNFEASILANVDGFTKSATLLNQTNRKYISFEFIPVSNKFRLKNKHIVNNSIFFFDREVFRTQVSTEEEVNDIGKFYIDHKEGIVAVYSLPKTKSSVRYEYVIYPFNLIASPVILNNINNEYFKTELYQRIINEYGTDYINTINTELGVDIINELLSVSPHYWGI